MTVTGSGLIVFLVAMTLLLPCAAVVVWPRVHGPRLVAGAQRVGIVLLCQVAALVLAAAVVNDYGYFYTSWSQVRGAAAQALGLGSDGGGPTVHNVAYRTRTASARPTPTSLDPASGGSVTRLDNGGTLAQWQKHGRTESVTITGAVSGLHEHAFVYLPPQYFQAKYATTRFPAIEALAGYPGDDILLLRRLHYTDIEQRLLAAGQMKPAVLVMLRPAVTFPRDTECTDVPGGPQVLTFLGADVPAQIAHSYRVQPTRWGVIGDSTGGYCAAKLAMTHPVQFPATVTLSGYFYALHDNTTGSLWGNSNDIRRSNDLFWRMQHLPAPPISMLIATARTEKGDDGYAQNIAFSHVVHAPTKATMLIESTGGHNFSTWLREIPASLRWLSPRIGERA